MHVIGGYKKLETEVSFTLAKLPFTLGMDHSPVWEALLYGFLLCEVIFTTTTSLSWNGWFHFTTSASKLVSGCVLGVFGSIVDWLVNSFIVYGAAHTQAKIVLIRTSRRGNAVSRNNFSCEARECYHACKNFGGGNCPVCPFLVAALVDTMRKNLNGDVPESYRMNPQFVFECVQTQTPDEIYSLIKRISWIYLKLIGGRTSYK